MKNFIVLSFLFLSLIVSGQKNKYKAEVEKTITEYGALVKTKNVDSMMNYMYPKFFDLYPRAPLAENMKKVFNDTTILISFSEVKITRISKVLEVDKVKYVLVSYDMGMSVDLKKNSAFASTDMLDMLKTNYESFYGQGNVVLDKANAKFSINVKNNMFAINNPAYGNRWYILEKKADMRSQLAGVLPDAAWDKLK